MFVEGQMDGTHPRAGQGLRAQETGCFRSAWLGPWLWWISGADGRVTTSEGCPY